MKVIFHACFMVFLGQLVTSWKIFEPCLSQSECPEGSTCMYRGCGGKLCLCNGGLLPDLNRTGCVQGVSLGSSCSGTSVCEGQPYSECINNVCECLDGYKSIIPSDSLRPSHCLPVTQGNYAGSEFVDFGGTCDDEKVYCSFDFVCKNRTCSCRDGKRLATRREMAASPYSILLCRPIRYQLGKPIDPSSEECKTQVTTSTITASMKSTNLHVSTSTPTPLTTRTTITQKPTTTTTTTSPKPTTPTTTYKTTPTTTHKTTRTTTHKTATRTTTQNKTTPTTTSKPTTPTTTQKTKIHTTPKETSIPTRTQQITTTQQTTTHMTTTIIHIPSKITTSKQKTTQKTSTPLLKITSPTTTQKATEQIITQNNASSEETTNTQTRTTETPILLSTNLAYTTASLPGHLFWSTTSAFERSTSNVTVAIGYQCNGYHCPNNSVCEEDSCGEKRCRCTLGYAESPDGLSCFKLAALGESCYGSSICQGPFTECTESGICDCQNEYERSDTGKWCRLKSRWLISFPLLGESCSGGFFSSCYMDFEQDCVGSRCKCKEGNREIGDEDRFAMYPDIRQCRNSSYIAGDRDKNLCKNQSKQSESTDLYDKAKAKIRKIQVAIIGGSVGFLVLVGILIGLIVLIRWKRRGKRQVIRDTSSMASSERYSFKIPRPFTHYVGAKEYDSQQIGYPNPTFEHDNDVSGSDVRPDVLNVSGDSSSVLTSNQQ